MMMMKVMMIQSMVVVTSLGNGGEWQKIVFRLNLPAWCW